MKVKSGSSNVTPHLNRVEFAFHKVLVEIFADDESFLSAVVLDALEGPKLHTTAPPGLVLSHNHMKVSSMTQNRSHVPVKTNKSF